MTSTPHDALFKAGFEDVENAADLFRMALPKPVVEAIAWPSMTLTSGSFIDPDLADRESDLLFTATVAGQPGYLYLLLEHQSTEDASMPLRLLVYMVRIWERHQAETKATAEPAQPLPVVLPIVVSHAPGGWSAPTSFHLMLDPAVLAVPELARFVPAFDLALEDLVDVTNAQLKDRATRAVARLILWALRDGRDADDLLENFDELGPLFVEVLGESRGIRAVARVLRYLALVTEQLTLDTFRAKIGELAPEAAKTAMTIAEQMRKEGRNAERIEVARKLLTLKFGSLDGATLARIEAASPEQLSGYLERVLTAESLDAVFAG